MRAWMSPQSRLSSTARGGCPPTTEEHSRDMMAVGPRVTSLETNRTHAVYANSLFVYPKGNESFVLPVGLPFSCAYPLDTDASLNVAIRPYLE
ncbi:unnamed protein product [Menidia menidia]|uniref:(Atlantic silverside) hypothetical protein n=1 Tax=Menidia menidia TaxID=238744 RepID=A0A8S4BB48_9TELE|nr:unnamed protein product [Menidia menidia]